MCYYIKYSMGEDMENNERIRLLKEIIYGNVENLWNEGFIPSDKLNGSNIFINTIGSINKENALKCLKREPNIIYFSDDEYFKRMFIEKICNHQHISLFKCLPSQYIKEHAYYFLKYIVDNKKDEQEKIFEELMKYINLNCFEHNKDVAQNFFHVACVNKKTNLIKDVFNLNKYPPSVFNLYSLVEYEYYDLTIEAINRFQLHDSIKNFKSKLHANDNLLVFFLSKVIKNKNNELTTFQKDFLIELINFKIDLNERNNSGKNANDIINQNNLNYIFSLAEKKVIDKYIKNENDENHKIKRRL